MKVGIIAPDPTDATSFYRAFGVFGPLSRTMGFEIVTGNDWSWPMIAACDVLFLQRPYDAAHVQVMEQARMMRVPTWIDYDDNIRSVESSNPSFGTFNTEEIQANFYRCIELATVVTCTTAELATVLGSKAQIIPNAFNDYFCGFSDKPRENNIVWRGSVATFQDLEEVSGYLYEIAETWPDFHFHFIGATPICTRKLLPQDRCHWYGFGTVWGYLALLYRLRPTVLLKPIADTPFGRCRSNCAWLEGTGAGAVTVAPDWPEWRMDGIVRDYGSFAGAVEIAIGDHARHLEESRKTIASGLLLSQVNKSREDLLRKLAAQPTKKGT